LWTLLLAVVAPAVLVTMRFSCGTRTLHTQSQLVWERQILSTAPHPPFRVNQFGRKVPERSISSCTPKHPFLLRKADPLHFRLLRRDNFIHAYRPLSTTTDGGNDRAQKAIMMRQRQLLQHITHSTRSLGVWEAMELHDSSFRSLTKVEGNVWESICKLPEVASAISNLDDDLPLTSTFNMLDSIQALERACQIFGSYQTDSIEHMACSALLAEFQNRSHLYNDCVATLRGLVRICNPDLPLQGELSDAIQIGLAKLHWLYGYHKQAKTICDTMVDDERAVEAAARTGQAMSRLLLVATLDDVFSVRDPFRMAVAHLERTVHPASTVLGAAYLNLGIAEAVWAESVSKYNDVDAPFDAAMRNWKQGLTTLKKGKSGTSRAGYRVGESSSLRAILRARLLANMAWGMLKMTHHADYVSRAMEFATESLAVYDSIYPVVAPASNDSVVVGNHRIAVEKEGLGRTLSLLGSCYHLNGDAVTAQGLFQSAFDKVPLNFSSFQATTVSSLQCLEQRDSYLRCAHLCYDWEKRESEAEKMNQMAEGIDSSLLPNGWSKKSSIHGSLWFWTPATSERH
jgi:hypothetical protein